jgi:hypothetical protein
VTPPPRLDLDPGTPAAMTTPLLRLFAVFWWLLVIGSAGFALYGTESVWENYRSGQVPNDPFWYVVGGAIVLLLSLLPFIALTVTRWIVTGSPCPGSMPAGSRGTEFS